MRKRGSVPIAEKRSAYLVSCSELRLSETVCIFRYLQKYEHLSMKEFWSRRGGFGASRRYRLDFACPILYVWPVEIILRGVLASAWPTTTTLDSARHNLLQT